MMTLPSAGGSLAGQVPTAQLGQTQDPRALVPGDPEALDDVAELLDAEAARMEEVGARLNRIDVPGWQGRASSAFLESLATERPRWLLASDSLAAGATAIREHAQVLRSAQRRAREAIDLWEQADAAAAAVRGEDATEPPPRPDVSAGGMLSLVDPGADLRARAAELLADGRRQVDESGSRVAEVLAGSSGRGDDAPGWLARIADVTGTAMREQGVGESASRFGLDGYRDWRVDLGEVELGETSMLDLGTEWAAEAGPVSASGGADVSLLGADSTAEFSLSGQDGLTAELSGRTYLAQANAEGTAEWGVAEVGAGAEAFAGAEAGVDASVGKDGLNVGAEAFVGARGEVTAHADVGGVGVGGAAEGWVGAGVEGDVTLGKNDDGSWTIGAEGGVALGPGGKLAFEVTVDPSEVIDTAASAADAVGDAAGSLRDAAGDVGDFVSSVPTPW